MALGEMASRHPGAGSFGLYAELYLNHWAGFVSRYAYWIGIAIAVGGELVASATYMGYWFPGVRATVWVIVFAAVLLFVNLRQVGDYGWFEFWFGMVKLVIFDNRPDSPTYRQINEFYLGEIRPQVIVVPRLCYHGWKCVSQEEAMILNCVTRPYDHKSPDEYRLDPHDNDVIPYHWQRRDG